jgi:hypothetical protein
MKKIFHVVSLGILSVVISVILGFLFTAINIYLSEKFENELEEVDEVEYVIFSDGKLAVTADEVIASVVITTDKGSELVIKNFGKVAQTYAGGRYYGNGVPEMISQDVITDRDMRVREGEWEYDCQVSTIKNKYKLDDIIFTNTYVVKIPTDITITRYGKSFTFEDIVLTANKVEDNFTEGYGKYLHRAYLNLDFGNYQETVTCVNEIYRY